MPSSIKYKANRKSHYKHESARQKALHGTKVLSAMKKSRKKLRTKLGLKKGDPRTGGHSSAKLSTKIKSGGKGGGGKIESASSNYKKGGSKKHPNKSLSKHGKNRKIKT